MEDVTLFDHGRPCKSGCSETRWALTSSGSVSLWRPRMIIDCVLWDGVVLVVTLSTFSLMKHDEKKLVFFRVALRPLSFSDFSIGGTLILYAVSEGNVSFGL